MRLQALTVSFLALISSCGGGGSGGGGNNQSVNQTSGTTTLNTPITSSVSGRVTDAAGNPVAGVTISIYQTNNHTTQVQTTDANGNYTGTDLMTGDYEIRAEKTGFGLYPDVSKSTGKIITSDYNALYRVVISFPKLSGTKATGANFTLLSGADKMFSLTKTGAVKTYLNGDDAALQKGIAWPSIRFVDNNNGTVTDASTGLIWMKNAGCITAKNWEEALDAANQLASGSCGLSDGSTAGQWRTPNINELESLVDVSQSNPSLPVGHPFTNLGDLYWSSTTYRGMVTEAWVLRFSDGRYMNDGIFNHKATSLNNLWAVKSGSEGAVKVAATGQFIVYKKGDDGDLHTGAPLPYPRFGDNADGTVTDYATGLVWLKKSDCINANWSDSVTAINQLANGQCELTDGSVAGDWRMPNRKEMVSMSDRVQGNHAQYFNYTFYKEDKTIDQPAILNNFITAVYYWTSSTNESNNSEAWTVYSCDFGIYNIAKSETGFAMAVRNYKPK